MLLFQNLDWLFYIEALGAVVSVAAIWLNTQQKAEGMLLSILASGVYMLFFAFVKPPMYGQAALQVAFAGTSLYGYFQWQKKEKIAQSNEAEHKLSAYPIILLYVGLGMILSTLFYCFLNCWGAASWHLKIDATLTAYSLVAQWLLVKKRLENWLFWLLINIVSAIWFAYSQFWFSAVLYVLFAILAIKGFWGWRSAPSTVELTKEQPIHEI